MNQADSLALTLLNGFLSRPEVTRFEFRGEDLLADGSPLSSAEPVSERSAAARIRYLAYRVGCPDADPKHLAQSWQAALASGRTRTRKELLEIARGLRTPGGDDPLDRWASAFRRRLASTLESRAWVEAFEPAAGKDFRDTHLELRPLVDQWPRRLLIHPAWAFVEAPLPRMDPLPLDQVWVDLEVVDFAMTTNLPSESRLTERLDRRYETRRWQAESVELVLDRLSGSAALVGPPGCGKTTLVKWLARHLITHPDDRFILPLVVPLRAYALWPQTRETRTGLLEFAVEQCGVRDARQKELWTNTLSYLAGVESEQVLFLLDGWDEVPLERRETLRAEINDLMHGFSMLITSRPSAYPRSLQTAHFYEISELAPESVEILVRRWLGVAEGNDGNIAAPARLLDHLERHTDLRRMARNPFLLTLLCGLFQEARNGPSAAGGGDLPTSRSELYSRTLRLIYAHHDQRRPDARLDAERRRQIERLALWLLGDAPGAPRYVFDSQDVADAMGDDELLERYLQPSRLLDQWDAETETHHFLHTTFQEYLAARALGSEGLSAAAKTLEEHLHDPSWQNVLHFLAGRPGPVGSIFWRQMTQLARRPDRFGLVLTRLARFVAESGASDGGMKLLGLDLRESLWTHIKDLPLEDLSLLFPYVDAYAALDRGGLVERLRAASSEDSPQARRFSRALALIQGSASSDHLVDVALGSAPGDLVALSSDLRRHLDDMGYRRLRDVARDAGVDRATRARAILALGYAADIASIPWLIELARAALSRSPRNGGLATEVVRSLAFMGGDESVHGLTAMLSWTTEPAWQRAVVSALGEIRSRMARDALLTELALRSPTDSLVPTILEKLWDRPIHRGRELMLDLLDGEADEATRATAVLALRQASGFGVERAIANAARHDPSERVRAAALQALERRASPVDISWLAERFTAEESGINDRQSMLRAVFFAAAQFAGSADGARLQATAVRLMGLALKLDPSLARDTAQHAHLVGVTAAPVLVETCLDADIDARVRSAACVALGRLRHRPAIEALAGLVRETSTAASRVIAPAAARALARIDIAALRDLPGDWALRALASHAVAQGYLIFDDVIIGPDGRPCALARAADPESEGEETEVARPVTRLMTTEKEQIPPPDLEIRVTLDDAGGVQQLIYTLHSYRFDAFNLKIPGDPLLRRPEDYLGLVFDTLEQLHKKRDRNGASFREAEVAEALEALGHQLYDELFPKEFKSAYRRLRRQRPETVLLVSDEPWIPWEIVKPYDDEDEDDVINDDYLCVQFQLTRWLSGSCAPARSIHVIQVAAVVAGSSTERPPSADAERRFFAELAERHADVHDHSLEDPDHAEIRKCIEEKNLDMIHFVGHGKYDNEDPDASGILLSDGLRFRPDDLHGPIRTQLRKNRPLVTLNACQLGRSGVALTRLGGWPPRFVRDAQVGALVAPALDGRRRASPHFFDGVLPGARSGRNFRTGGARGADQGPRGWASHLLRLYYLCPPQWSRLLWIGRGRIPARRWPPEDAEELGATATAFVLYKQPGGNLDPRRSV